MADPERSEVRINLDAVQGEDIVTSNPAQAENDSDANVPFVETLAFADYAEYAEWADDAHARARAASQTMEGARPDNPQGQIMLEIFIGRRQNPDFAATHDEALRRARALNAASTLLGFA